MASEPVRVREVIAFEDFEFDVRLRELRRAGRVLKLERIPSELLLLLIEQRGNIITREQIVERIWGSGVFLDSDNSINGAIRKVRQVLKDNPEHPRFIQTITGKGYRFIAAVAEPAKPVPPPKPPAPVVEFPAPKPDTARRWALPIALLVLFLLALNGWLIWHYRQRPQPASGRVMLAVLPFENMTGDPSQEYFSDGLTEEMITQVGNLDNQRLGVIARTSVMHYKHTRVPLTQVARELGVQYVLEGSVRRDGERVRVTAQLIKLTDQTHLWAREYDRDLKSLFAVQGEIAQAVADEIQITLDSRKKSLAPPSPAGYEAYDLYLKGRFFLNKRTVEGLRQSVEYFEQAVAKDPNYARAQAGLADSYSMMSSYGVAPASELMPKARAAASQAIRLDEHLAEGHTSLALILESYDWDWKSAEKEFRRAIELDSNYATAHHWYAELLGFQGRFDEALAEIERARRLDPLSLIIASDQGAILYFARHFDRAVEQFRLVRQSDPIFPRSHLIVYALVGSGKHADALAEIQKWRHQDNTPWTFAAEAYTYGRLGKPAEAQRALDNLVRIAREQHLNSDYMLAVAYSGMGEKDKAYACLEQAYAEHSPLLPTLKVDPIFDSLRGDRRFEEFLRRVRLQ